MTHQLEQNQLIDKIEFHLEPQDEKALTNLLGPLNQNLSRLESLASVSIANRSFYFQIQSTNLQECQKVQKVIYELYKMALNRANITQNLIHQVEHKIKVDLIDNEPSKKISIKTPNLIIDTKGINQYNYINNVKNNSFNFCIGPAGTGKTFLAVALAIESLMQNAVDRLVLVRPAIEAGESLGFLPGDFMQKVNPYLRPMYDAIFAMLGVEKANLMIEKNKIEIVPLAYMRGRTLSNAFVIVDEAQNTTKQQMKMVLTRIGFDSKIVITGDTSQIDLPSKVISGLIHANKTLENIKGLSFSYLKNSDIMRHRLIRQILEAYEQENKTTEHSQIDKKNENGL